jgi:DNA repair protein RadC
MATPAGNRSARDCGCLHDPGAAAKLSARARALGPVANSAAAYWLLEPLVSGSPIELAHVTLLDDGAHWRTTRLLSRGDRTSVEVPIDRLLQDALRADCSCRYVLLSHNHPAGWAWPSEADGELTADLDRACFDSGLYLLDHVILGRQEFFSFREGTLWTIRS